MLLGKEYTYKIMDKRTDGHTFYLQYNSARARARDGYKFDGEWPLIADPPDANSTINTDTFRCASIKVLWVNTNSVLRPGKFCVSMQICCVQANFIVRPGKLCLGRVIKII